MQLKQMNITDLNVRYREEGPDVGDTEDMEE